jgi:hypothetical protein
MMNRLLLVVLLAEFLTFSGRGAKPKESDFPIEFLVQTASISDGVVTMSLESDRKLYYVVSTECWHCSAFQPGSRVHGRWRLRDSLTDLLFTNDHGQLKVGHYAVKQIVLLGN